MTRRLHFHNVDFNVMPQNVEVIATTVLITRLLRFFYVRNLKKNNVYKGFCHFLLERLLKP